MATRIDLDDLVEDAIPEEGNKLVINYGQSGSQVSLPTVNINSRSTPNIQIGKRNHMQISIVHPSTKTKPNIKCKIPLTTSTAEPTKNHFDALACHIGADWRKLGRTLKLSKGELETLKIDYEKEGQYEVVYHMLLKWMSTFCPVTVQQLAQACVSIGRGDLADSLR
ncbi:receptor-interacting serine/threonine-protein kinase 1-like isoform X2 [Gigantopelta aegis]|uniref:receptor-interacting serine/threonine-protein kinase 1-like isoform X2 n=1 Tax=Gigantopelta aegis TaxID=1735272 RepID=UPI001B88DD36|nr:receptor-interacting serine/threonine-protein kinase 1-like isoform X2 [Gigantopelta aegis]